MDVPTILLGNHEFTVYALLMAAGLMLTCLCTVFITAKKHSVEKSTMALYDALAAFFGIFLGRLIYCWLHYEDLFFDELGASLGISPFFDLSLGSICVIGVCIGFMTAAPIVGSACKEKGRRLLDAAALPALFFFAFARLIEPLSGHGYGIDVETEAFQFFPLMLENGGLAVCYIEAALALAIAVVLILLRKKFHRGGTLFLTALTLLSASQILPESFRQDEYLFIFVFARINQIGFAVFLAVAQMMAFLLHKKHFHLKKYLIEFALLLLGAGVCIAAEFSLEGKLGFHWPHLVIYAIMALALCLMAFVVLHRIRKEEKR